MLRYMAPETPVIRDSAWWLLSVRCLFGYPGLYSFHFDQRPWCSNPSKKPQNSYRHNRMLDLREISADMIPCYSISDRLALVKKATLCRLDGLVPKTFSASMITRALPEAKVDHIVQYFTVTSHRRHGVPSHRITGSNDRFKSPATRLWNVEVSQCWPFGRRDLKRAWLNVINYIHKKVTHNCRDIFAIWKFAL